MRLDRDRRLLEKRGRRKAIKSSRQSAAVAGWTVKGKTEKGSGTNHGLLFNYSFFFLRLPLFPCWDSYTYYIRPFRKRHGVSLYPLFFLFSFSKNVCFPPSFRGRRTPEIYILSTLNMVGRGRDLRRSGNIVRGESRAEGRSVKVSRRGQRGKRE